MATGCAVAQHAGRCEQPGSVVDLVVVAAMKCSCMCGKAIACMAEMPPLCIAAYAKGLLQGRHWCLLEHEI